MTRPSISLLAAALILAVAAPSSAQDRREDFRDRREDLRDSREDVRDSLYHRGPADRLEDHFDAREDRADQREDARDAADIEWWRSYPAFQAYMGPRRGYYYAPGHGYYIVPAPLYGRVWRPGLVLPVPLRRYPVLDLALYRLPPPPPGYGWRHVDNDIVLIALATGVIVDSIMDVF